VVAAGDLQRRLAEEWLGDLQLALVALAVDDPHAIRGDRNVVDVRSGASDAPVVQDPNTRAVLL